MHMADALLSPTVGGVMYAASAAAALWSVKEARLDDEPRKVAMMGVMGAFVFAVQMLNFTIPGTGSSGHLCGGMLLSALLGPAGGFLTMIGVLAVQCLLFADGGILAFGANCWNMAFYGCFVGSLLIWRPMMRSGVTRGKIVAASVIGCVVTLQLGAFSVTLQTLASGITALPFGVFVGAMQPIHLAIGAIEGLITASVLLFVHEARPELIWLGGGARKTAEAGRLTFGATVTALAVASALAAGIISLYASENPDGLEWSMERVAGTAELEAEGGIHESLAAAQERTALLPDYNFPSEGEDDEGSSFGTSFSGIAGGLAVVAVSLAACRLFGFYRGRGRSAASI